MKIRDNVTGNWPPPFTQPPFLSEDWFQFLWRDGDGDGPITLATPPRETGKKVPTFPVFLSPLSLDWANEANQGTRRFPESVSLSSLSRTRPSTAPYPPPTASINTTKRSSRQLASNHCWDEDKSGWQHGLSEFTPFSWDKFTRATSPTRDTATLHFTQLNVFRHLIELLV